MGILDFLGRGNRRGTEGGGVDGPIGLGTDDAILDEPGEGGPSVLMPDLAALRWAAQQEAVNVGRMPLEPEQWDGGRMAFEYERHLAHDHEGLRDRLSDFVAASARDVVADLYQTAGSIAEIRDDLRVADTELAVVLDSWNRSYREVHEDELELGRYFRLKSKPYQLSKWLIALAIFGAEFAISVALFDKVVSQDNAAMPYLFAMGLILILMVVPHYSAIGIKEGVTRYHEAELDAYEKARVPTPAKLRKKARIEEVEDRGAKLVAGVVGLVLVLLFIPLSLLRAKELGGADEHTFWFWFFMLVQFAISGYFFLREWWDYGTASANLKHHDLAKRDASQLRANVYSGYTEAVSEFMTRSQDLTFLYRQAPRWDSYLVQCYLGTIHHFRHLVTLNNPELDVFIAHATVPYLGTNVDQPPTGAKGEFAPVSREHQELMTKDDTFSRGWWMKQIDAALIDSVGAHGGDDVVDEAAPGHTFETPLSFESPERLLAEFLDRYFGLEHPYRRPKIMDHIEEVDDDIEPHAVDDSGEAVRDEPTSAASNGGIINLGTSKRRGATGEGD